MFSNKFGLFFKKFSRNFCTQASNSFKYSQYNQRDCIRLMSLYGVAGGLTSTLSLMVNDKLIVLKCSKPTPERFLFFVSCWSLAGMISWYLVWTKSDLLFKAASHPLRFGINDGSRVSVLAFTHSFILLSSFSIYFDYDSWKNNNSNNNNNYLIEGTAAGSSELNNNTNSSLIVEENNDDKKDTNNNNNEWNWNNVYKDSLSVCESFLLSNGIIWILTGSLFGIFASKLANANIVNACLFNSIIKNDEINPILNDDDNDQI